MEEFCRNLTVSALAARRQSVRGPQPAEPLPNVSALELQGVDYALPSICSEAAMTVAPDGTAVCGVACLAGGLRTYRLSPAPPLLATNDAKTTPLRRSSAGLSSLQFDPSFWRLSAAAGKALCAGSDGCARLFTCDFGAEGPERYVAFPHVGESLLTARYAGATGHFVSVARSGRYFVMDIESERCVRAVKAVEASPSAAEVSREGVLLYLGDETGYGALFDLRVFKFVADFSRRREALSHAQLAAEQGRQLVELPALEGSTVRHRGRVTCAAFADCAPLLATGSADGTARLWDLRRMQLVETVPAHLAQLCRVSLSPSGRRLVSAGIDGCVRSWDWLDCRVVDELALGEKAQRVVLSPDWAQMAVVRLDRRFEFYRKNAVAFEPGSPPAERPIS